MGRIEWGNRPVAYLAIFLFLFGIAASGLRVAKKYHQPGPFSHETPGFCDFHNGLYFPTVALIDGVSPYGQKYMDAYPVSRQLPFFSPAILVLHIPIAILPLRAAEIVYFTLLCSLVLSLGVVIASIAGRPKRLDWIFVIAAALIFSRGALSTFYDGYFTLELTLATILAVHWGKNKPWLAALALVVVSAKPTYILPLGFLLLARGNYKALTIGAVFSVVGAFVPFAWLASHSGSAFPNSFVEIAKEIGSSQDFHITVLDEMPLHTWTRIDVFAIVAKWLNINPSQTFHALVMLPLLVVPMLVLFRRQQKGIDDGVAGITGLVVLTATLATVYHHSYDALILLLPLVAVLLPDIAKTARRGTDNSSKQVETLSEDGERSALSIWCEYPKTTRWLIALLICVQLYNYLSSRMFLSRIPDDPLIFKIMTSISGLGLTVLTVIACVLAWRETTRITGEINSVAG